MIHCNEYKQGTQWKSYTALSVVCFPSNSMFYKPVDFGLLGKVPENHMQPVAFRGWEGLLGQALPGPIYQGASWSMVRRCAQKGERVKLLKLAKETKPPVGTLNL